MKRQLFLTMCLLLTMAMAHAGESYTLEACSHFGGNFTKTVNGVDIIFTFTDNDHEAVQVGGVYVGFVAWGIAYPAVEKSTYGTVVIPSSVEYEGHILPVEAIHVSAFERVPISKVVIPASVKKIDHDAFYGCTDLEEVEFESAGDRTVKIGPRAFSGCTSLKSVTGGNHIVSIEKSAFRGCALESVEIPRTCKEIASDAFFDCKSLKSFYAQSGGYYSVDKDGVLFKGFKLVAYPSGNSLSAYSIPQRTTEIGAYAFNNCENLSKLTIPASVRSMEETCIWNCKKISDSGGYLRLEWLDGQEVPPTGKYTFGGMPYNILIPKGTENVYKYGVWGTLQQSTYDMTFPFSVDGVSMTSENYRDFRKGVTSGTVSYNPGERVLTLDNAHISATKAEAEGITISLVGDNTMQLKQAFTIKDETYIDGPGSLTLNGDDCGLAIEGYLILDNTPTVEINAKTPIDGAGKGGINMDAPAFLTLNPGNGKPVVGMKYFDMDESFIYSPEGAYLKNGELYTYNGPVYGSVEIIPKDYSKSPASICGVRLTDNNWHNFTHCVTEGKVSYDSRPNTLTLDNATIICDNGSCGISLKTGMTIKLIGNNYIRTDNNGISIDADGADVFVEGDGRLEIESKSGIAIFAGQGNITFYDTTVQLYGQKGCFSGGGEWSAVSPGNSSSASVHFVNTDATLLPCSDTTMPVVTNISDFTLENCAFNAPAGVHFHKPSATLCDLSGGPLAGKSVSIAKSDGTVEYTKLYVAGTPVTDDNKSCIMEGVTYDSSNNILILHDAHIDGKLANFNVDKASFGTSAKSLDVCVLGANTIAASTYTPVVFVGRNSEISFYGGGSLTVRNESNNNGYGIALFEGATLRLTDVSVDVESQRSAIAAINPDGPAKGTSMYIDNTTLHAKAVDTGYAAIEGIGAVRHAWCKLTAPNRAYYNNGTSYMGGEKVSDITISPCASGLRIAGTPITKDNARSPEEGDGTSLLKSGSYTYDDFTKTLYLFDANIEATEDDTDGIFIDANGNSTNEGLVIVYSGNCTIKGTRHAINAEDAKDYIPIAIASIAYESDEPKNSVTTLTLATTGTTAVRLGSEEAYVLLYDADVKVVGDIVGVADDNFVGLETNDCTLLIDGSVSGLTEFYFAKDYNSYATPGQYFDDDKGYVANADGSRARGVNVVRKDGTNPFDNTIERPKDVNLDGVTDVADIASVIDVMASDEVGSTQKAASDTNGDGGIDVADVATVIDAMAGD